MLGFSKVPVFCVILYNHIPGWRSRYSDWLRAGPFGVRSPVGTRKFLQRSFRPALWSTLPLQWVLHSSPWYSDMSASLITRPCLTLYLCSPLCLHCTQQGDFFFFCKFSSQYYKLVAFFFYTERIMHLNLHTSVIIQPDE